MNSVETCTAQRVLDTVDSQRDLAELVDVHLERSRKRLEAAFNPLTPKEALFVTEYALDFDRCAAARRAGYQMRCGAIAYALINNERVQNAMRAVLQEHTRVSALKAEYVRDYIYTTLEFCPLDYFTLTEDGWVIDANNYQTLPPAVKRMISGVSLTRSGGKTMLSVDFVSKDSALALAARYTLTEHHEMLTATVPWDQLAGVQGPDPDERVEAEIAAAGTPNLPAVVERNGHAA